MEIAQLAEFTLLPYVVQGSVGAASGAWVPGVRLSRVGEGWGRGLLHPAAYAMALLSTPSPTAYVNLGVCRCCLPLPPPGILADKLLVRGWPIKRVRRVLQTVGMLGPAACMVAAASPLTDGNPGAASAWITVGLGLNALTLAGVSVSHLDIAPKHAGVVFAAGNTAATLAGLLAVKLTGVVLEATDSWSLVFAITAAHYVVGAALFAWWVGDRLLPQDG